MGKVNTARIEEVRAEKDQKSESLRRLILDKFDEKNLNHMKELKERINHFEMSTNKMYLFEALTLGQKVQFNLTNVLLAFGGYAIFKLLPMPDFISYIGTQFIYYAAIAMILEDFCTTDFDNELKEMEIIYNWCLKENKTNYEATDNSEKLKNPDIQRLIKLMSPLCPTNFMIVWPKVIATPANENNQQNIWGSFFKIPKVISNTASAVYNTLVASTPSSQDEQVRELKIKVETRSFDMTSFAKGQSALHYFVTHPKWASMYNFAIKQAQRIGVVAEAVLPEAPKQKTN